jgi:hypothetical protein
LSEVCTGLFRDSHIRFADNLDQRDACPVEIDHAHRSVRVVDEFACVLLHMNPCDPDPLFPPVDADGNMSLFRDRQFILRYLVTLGKVGVKVVLSGKATLSRNRAIRGQCHANGVLNHFAVQHRQNPRHAETYRTGVGIGRCPELGRATTKDLALGQQLGMDFKADNGFIGHLSILNA